MVEINSQAVFQEENKKDVLALALSSLTECDSYQPKDHVGLVGMHRVFEAEILIGVLTSANYYSVNTVYDPNIWL